MDGEVRRLVVVIRAVALDDPGAVPALVALRRAWVEERDGAPIDDPGFDEG